MVTTADTKGVSSVGGPAIAEVEDLDDVALKSKIRGALEHVEAGNRAATERYVRLGALLLVARARLDLPSDTAAARWAGVHHQTAAKAVDLYCKYGRRDGTLDEARYLAGVDDVKRQSAADGTRLGTDRHGDPSPTALVRGTGSQPKRGSACAAAHRPPAIGGGVGGSGADLAARLDAAAGLTRGGGVNGGGKQPRGAAPSSPVSGFASRDAADAAARAREHGGSDGGAARSGTPVDEAGLAGRVAGVGTRGGQMTIADLLEAPARRLRAELERLLNSDLDTARAEHAARVIEGAADTLHACL